MSQIANIREIIPDYIGNNKDIGIDYMLKLFFHTDAGVEIDDEIAIGYILRWLINSQSNVNIQMLISVKTGQEGVNRLIKYGVTPFTSIILNPIWDFPNIIPITGTNKTITIIFHDGLTFVPNDYNMHYIASISPGLDNVLKLCNLYELCGFTHQGLLGEPGWYGFNESGSVEVLKHLKNIGKPYKVAKPLDCFHNFLFSNELFKQYDIPESLWNIIAGDAFKNIIGRMPPTVPDHVKPHFATLVNLTLANKYYKPGTNKRLVDSIREKYTGPIACIDDITQLKIMNACIQYVDSFPNEDREGTLQGVYELTFKLAEMNMPFLHNSKRLIYSTDGNLSEIYSDAFSQFCTIGIFTPAYDLKAIDNLKELITENNALCI